MVHPLSVRSHIFQKDLFGELPPSTARDFAALESRVFCAGDTELFRCDEPALVVFVVHSGSVALSRANGTSTEGTTAIADEVLGLTPAVAGEVYQFTARTLEFSEIGFISRTDLVDFLATHSEFAFRVVRLLSENLSSALDHLRALPAAVQA
jgi:CRP-like cAMP-binding protein